MISYLILGSAFIIGGLAYFYMAGWPPHLEGLGSSLYKGMVAIGFIKVFCGAVMMVQYFRARETWRKK